MFRGPVALVVAPLKRGGAAIARTGIKSHIGFDFDILLGDA